MLKYKTPGVYYEERFPSPVEKLQTGVPAILGYIKGNAKFNEPQPLTHWSEFQRDFGAPLPNGYLAYAVRGFFKNGGSLCYVVPLKDTIPPEDALLEGLAALEPLCTIDLVCTPDIMRSPPPMNLTNDPCAPDLTDSTIWSNLSPLNPDSVITMQSAVLEHCHRLGNRFAILDSLPHTNEQQLHNQRRGLNGASAALYYPWVRVQDDSYLKSTFVPPCGHVAGVYARSDQKIGVYKAPANEVLKGVLELEVNLTNRQQGLLNQEGINCLHTFPGREILVWGARTLSHDPEWTYINVRRLFLTVIRWIERNMLEVVFEPNDASLWNRIKRDLTDYFNDLFRQGALKGSQPEEAFYVKCDEDTNPPQVREAGQVVTEIGLAPIEPCEFIIVTIIHGTTGVTISGVPKLG
ncbi:phage tail sheath family protein [Calothrix sp. NIES-2098]|uniref:phage tail sheath family protein n=1 Tax=Calothrix sp. NIES-2098 TaxID=1954171 RepID=UPI000B5FE3AF|nr:phage tail sheath protein fi-like protein [Calothrix sp. NIES-2098]